MHTLPSYWSSNARLWCYYDKEYFRNIVVRWIAERHSWGSDEQMGILASYYSLRSFVCNNYKRYCLRICWWKHYNEHPTWSLLKCFAQTYGLARWKDELSRNYNLSAFRWMLSAIRNEHWSRWNYSWKWVCFGLGNCYWVYLQLVNGINCTRFNSLYAHSCIRLN